MEIEKLTSFVTLAKMHNFSKTAEILFCSQSTISKHIKSLEKEFDVVLFERTNRIVKLSEAGKVILKSAEKIVSENQIMVQRIKTLKDDEKATVKLSAIPTARNYPAFLQVLKAIQSSSNVVVKFTEAESSSIFDEIKQEINDIAFVRLMPNMVLDECFEWVPVYRDRLSVVVSKESPLANDEKVDIKRLKDNNFILPDKKTKLQQPINKLCYEAGYRPNIVFEGERINTIISMVSSELGISLLFKGSLHDENHERIKVLKLTPSIYSTLGFIRKKDRKRSKAAEQIWREISIPSWHDCRY